MACHSGTSAFTDRNVEGIAWSTPNQVHFSTTVELLTLLLTPTSSSISYPLALDRWGPRELKHH